MQRYYYGLDGLRFFAAFAVCVFHLGFYVWASQYSSISGIFDHRASFEALTSLAWLGWVGVQIFFVISGFVIANSANGATPFGFLRSRLLRLWPAAWICATVTLAVRLMTGEDFWRDLDESYLRSLILWPKGDWIDGAYWSLAVEISFYALVFALLLSSNFKRIALLAWGLTLVSACYLGLAWVEQSGAASLGGWFDALAAQSEFLPLRHGVFFAIGIWMWMLANRSMTVSSWVGGAIAMAFAMLEIEIRAWEVESTEAIAALGQPLIAPVIIWLLAVGLMLACTRYPQRFAPKSEKTRSCLIFAGKITYPLYLVHSAVGAASMAWLIDLGLPPYLALVTAIAFVICLAAGIAQYGEPLARKPLRAALDATGASAGRLKPLARLFRHTDPVPLKQA